MDRVHCVALPASLKTTRAFASGLLHSGMRPVPQNGFPVGTVREEQMRKKFLDQSIVSRRDFLKGVTLTGAAALATPVISARAQQPPAEEHAKVVPQPNIAAETQPPPKDPVTQTSSGGDFMVDVLKTLDIDYLAMNAPRASAACMKRSSTTAQHQTRDPHLPARGDRRHMAQGYAKIEGKPMAFICHGVVGLQHATMAMYNAWCDRVPVICMGGNIIEADKRMPGAEWVHSAIDPAAIVRDFVKWDDQPASLQHFAESTVRAYKIATTPPMGPVMLSLDAELQENPISDRESLRIPKLVKVIPPQGDRPRSPKLGKMLVAAENPVHHLRSRVAHAGRHCAHGGTRRGAAMRRWSTMPGG